jgi:hypothetical protein
MVDVCCFNNQGFLTIYYHMSQQNEIGLSTPAELLRQNNMHADLKHDKLNASNEN